MKPPRIAIIGNMNNNGFAIMRYFRDLGVDAYLLPWLTDSQGNLSHFAPRADTWEFDRWKPYIRPLDIPNSSHTLIGNLFKLKFAPTSAKLKSIFSGYDLFVGSGIAPALFERIGRRLDIFFPYGSGIEFYDDIKFRARRKSSLFRRVALGYVRRLQANGIRNARHCFNSEMSITKASFEEIGRSFEHLAVPMVYNREDIGKAEISTRLSSVIERMKATDFSIFCSSRMLWVRDSSFSESDWRHYTKNSDWVFHGLAKFLKTHRGCKPVLYIVEYGEDVDASKRLCAELKLESYVMWLPKMPRKELLLLLSVADIGVGEFKPNPGMIWGGTGWEVLAAGRPLLQGFNFTEEKFMEQFGHPAPPVLDVKSADDIAKYLSEIYNDPGKGHEIGAACLDWFNRHNGISLAKKWLSLLRKTDETMV